MGKIVEEVVVKNPLGIHARPASALARRANDFESDIYLTYKKNRVNAKSIMGLLTLGAAHGSRIEVLCSGPDAEEAMAAIKNIFEEGFGEK